MSIHIPHRFIERLTPSKDTTFIHLLIIGTFNPGEPNDALLSDKELSKIKEIRASKKYQKFNLVKNFYDRPQNRFWKIMDIIYNPSFYFDKPKNFKNTSGLKFYTRKMDREAVFNSQKAFCSKYGVFITDIVRKIHTDSFQDIYDKFPDKKIELSKCDWNTDDIIDIIENFNPKKILINFKQSPQLPKISKEVEKIREAYPDKIISLASTSGAAGNTYDMLYEEWRHHFNHV